MTDIAAQPKLGPKVGQSTLVQTAVKEMALTLVLVFLLSVFMVGMQTQATQGQNLGYVVRFGDVVWTCILVPLGRLLIVLDRARKTTPAIVGGLLGFIYLFGGGAIGVAGWERYPTLPLPFDEPMVNLIFGFGA